MKPAALLASAALLFALCPRIASGSRPRESGATLTAWQRPAVVRDESDPKETQSCYALGGLEISYSSETKGAPIVGVVLTDPRGRRIGRDPLAEKGWQELPQAQAFIDCTDVDSDGNPAACTGSIQICGPLSGTYRLQVMASESGSYSVTVSGISRQARDEQGLRSTNSHTEENNVRIQKENRDTFLLDYSRDPGSKVELVRSGEPANPHPKSALLDHDVH